MSEDRYLLAEAIQACDAGEYEKARTLIAIQTASIKAEQGRSSAELFNILKTHVGSLLERYMGMIKTYPTPPPPENH